MFNRLKRVLPKIMDNMFFLREQEGESNETGPSWNFRRKLIYGTYRLSFAMIIFGAITYYSDTSVGSGLVAGGVTLLSVILTAYTAAATYQDIKLWKTPDEEHQE